MNLSLVAATALCLFSTASASSFAEALTSGKVSGEFAVTYEKRDFDNEANGATYYRDSAYSVGSFALKYETGVWNNFSLTSKFRAYKKLYENEDDSITSYGQGDASERFRFRNWDGSRGEERNADVEELYLTYKLDNFSIKAGRQFISTDWVNKTQDAVKIDANIGDTSLEAIWSARHGRIYSRDYRPMTKFNENRGVYKLGLTHKFSDMISVTAYDAIYPEVRDIYGGKVNLKFGDTSVRAHYANSSEDSDSTAEDSDLIDLMVSTSIAGFSPYAGYIKVDDDAAFPGYAGENSGEIIVPFEEGDYVYSQGAETFYVGVSKSFGELSSTLLYGTTEYISGSDKLDVHETTLWLGYPITKNFKANLGYTLVDEDNDSSVSDYDQVNLTLTYSF
jgi:hypothetical protein